VFKLPRKTLINSAIVLAALLLVTNFLSCFKTPALKLTQPHLSLIEILKRETFGLLHYHRNMLMVEKLQTEVKLLRLRLFDLREFSLENSRLKKLLSFKQKASLRFVPGRVIGRSVDSWSSSLIIDKGKYQGIKSGMVVICPEGLVGSIIETNMDTSKVLLINDPNQGVSGIVQRSRQEGLVSGTLGTNLIMRYLPDEADIVPGDVIVTSELSQIYPKGLLVGRVVNVGREFSGLNRYAMVKPTANLANIEEVLVIIP